MVAGGIAAALFVSVAVASFAFVGILVRLAWDRGLGDWCCLHFCGRDTREEDDEDDRIDTGDMSDP